MKKRFITTILTIAITLGTVLTTTAKAQSFDDTYKGAYNTVVKLQEIGNKYHITPRHANDGTTINSNTLVGLAEHVEELQDTIDELRNYQHQFPAEYWKARNTFSEIGDGYQQPIYEWIVETAVHLQGLLEKAENEPNKTNVELFKNHCDQMLTLANKLNKGVDPAYRGAYQAALDDLARARNTIKAVEVKAVDKEALAKKYAEILNYKQVDINTVPVYNSVRTFNEPSMEVVNNAQQAVYAKANVHMNEADQSKYRAGWLKDETGEWCCYTGDLKRIYIVNSCQPLGEAYNDDAYTPDPYQYYCNPSNGHVFRNTWVIEQDGTRQFYGPNGQLLKDTVERSAHIAFAIIDGELYGITDCGDVKNLK